MTLLCFYGKWSTPPDPSIPMPSDGSDLFVIIPVHVDDGLTATNSTHLYSWLISELNKCFKVNDLGPTDVFLGMKIERERKSRKLWISQMDYLEELLQLYNMSDVNPSTIPLCSKTTQP